MRADGWVGRWSGRTVVCIASGPSLTPDDCEAVHAAGHPTIVTNTTFRLCPWADALFAFDSKWWREYRAEVDKVFLGDRLAYSEVAAQSAPGVICLRRAPWFTSFHNSGASSISVAAASGARRVLLLGFDCQKTGGRTHWHGDHPKTLGNAASLKNWPKQFQHVARYAQSKGTKVLNCSRATALTCFERAELSAVL
jgi:hypothetical protein